MRPHYSSMVGILAFVLAPPLLAQDPNAATAALRQAAPPPATKLEAFKPAAGSVTTLGYTELGTISGITIDVREMKDARASSVRGLLVDIRESQYRKERSFVDADEVPELLKGIDALLEVSSNPTKFKSFEVRYKTRGELEVVAFNNDRGKINYAVRAGRVVAATSYIDAGELRRLRDAIASAADQLR